MSYFFPLGLVPPRDLEFSEVTSRSFRATWVTDVFDVMAYLVRFRPAADTTGDYISLVVPGDTTTSILPHLIPLTTYEVNVIAQYDKGDSFPLTGEETTLEGEIHQLIKHKPEKQNVFVFLYFYVISTAEYKQTLNVHVIIYIIKEFYLSFQMMAFARDCHLVDSSISLVKVILIRAS